MKEMHDFQTWQQLKMQNEKHHNCCLQLLISLLSTSAVKAARQVVVVTLTVCPLMCSPRYDKQSTTGER